MKDIKFSEIENVMNENVWGLSNRVLYEMCKNYPLHESPNIIASKFLIIGRTYAASVERRKINTGISSEKFYEEILIPKIREHGKEIDESIKLLHNYEGINENNIHEVLVLHGRLTDILCAVSGQKKRSLASKYLHFHVPHMFYIYDSRAVSSMKLHGFMNKPLQKKLQELPVDEQYMKFSIRMLKMQKYIERNFKKKLSPRQLDRLLLNI